MSDLPPPAKTSVRDQFDLTGRVCVITGGAGFLGRQFAAAVAEMGGTPVLFDWSEEALQEGIAALKADWGACDGEVIDVTDIESLRKATDRVLERHGRIDVLINNHGLTTAGLEAKAEDFFRPFEDTLAEVWDAGLSVNLTGVAHACQVIGPVMVRQGGGSIINIGSDVGVISPDLRIYQPDDQGYPGMKFNIPAFYAVTKAGVIHLTKYLATLWAQNGVRVNAFSPAGVRRNHDPQFVEKLTQCIPMGRMARENEFKGAIVFLASDASAFMTGHNMVMDGGRTVW